MNESALTGSQIPHTRANDCKKIALIADGPIMELRQLIYLSKIKAPIGLCDVDISRQLEEIHKTSVRNNASASVTGLLLFSGGCFLQVLEGRRLVLERLFERIAADERHTDLERLCDNEIDDRMFGSWNMGLLNLEAYRGVDRELFLSFGSLISSARLSGDDVQARETTVRLLRTFKDCLAVAA